MKFGKRLIQEASRRWASHYIDYKGLKRAIKEDLVHSDAYGHAFQRVLLAELQKVSAFYSDCCTQLEADWQVIAKTHEQARFVHLRSEVKELIKFVALNYLAVVKAIKKRNKNLKERHGSLAPSSLHALNVLGNEVFFTSPRLALLATQIEVLSSEASLQCTQAALEEFQCPICLDTLHNPVVLTCAHRFCWGCLVAFCTTLGNTAPVQLLAEKAAEGASSGGISGVLEQIASSSEQQDQQRKYFNCPVCRKPQVMDVDNLAIDAFLANYIQGLKAISSMAVTDKQQQPSSPPEEPSWGIIPPQAPQHKGKLTVLLDLDGTLIASYTPRRAPRLPPSVRTHVVGVGSKLNPTGVFVVERPGLREFLEELSSFAEVIIFTAGLEDYAKPIIDAIDPHNRFFTGRIYREGTLRTEYYQCVKDMARLNRDLSRTILVDDTPLAFLHQPDNGVPVLGFRGDPDDRLLMEAVLPLCQVLRNERDVRLTLQRRFDMCTWFRRNSFPIDGIMAEAQEAVKRERRAALAPQSLPASPARQQQQAPTSASSAQQQQQLASGAGRFAHFMGGVARQPSPSKPALLLMDFDNTLTSFDAGERLTEQLAPELLPMLVGLDPATSYIPITNTILSEMQRRGVSRDALVATLQALGAEVPEESVELLRAVHGAGVDVKVLSDANSVFISHILAGAKASGYLAEVITNAAAFERVGRSSSSSGSSVGSGTGSSNGSSGACVSHDGSAPPSPSTSPCSSASSIVLPPGIIRGTAHKLVIQPHHQCCAGQPAHGCPRCPENMCKGLAIARIKHASAYQRIVFCGDGSNDICGALSLGPEDILLARLGFPLAQYVLESRAKPEAYAQVAAQVQFWSSHEELKQLALAALAQCGCAVSSVSSGSSSCDV